MTSLVWVRRKTKLCEICNRVMELGEDYLGRCKNCGCDFCKDCRGRHSVCTACARSSLFRAGAPALA